MFGPSWPSANCHQVVVVYTLESLTNVKLITFAPNGRQARTDMTGKRRSFRGLAAFLAVVALASYLSISLAAASSPAGKSLTKTASPPQQTLTLSHDGVVVATYRLSCGAGQTCNRIEFDWKAGTCPSGSNYQSPPVTVVLTSGFGQFSGIEPAIAPCKANDIEFTPVQTAGTTNSTISSAWWTRNGVMTARILPPQVSLIPKAASVQYPPVTGIHGFWDYKAGERLTRVRLLHGRKVVASLKVPPSADMADWVGYPTQLFR